MGAQESARAACTGSPLSCFIAVVQPHRKLEWDGTFYDLELSASSRLTGKGACGPTASDAPRRVTLGPGGFDFHSPARGAASETEAAQSECKVESRAEGGA